MNPLSFLTQLPAATTIAATHPDEKSSACSHLEGQTNKNSKGKVLLVASSTNAMQLKGGKTVHTGYILAELALPAMRFITEGYEVEVATPEGNPPAMDALSVDVSMFDGDPEKMQAAMVLALMHPTMQRPLKLRDVVAKGLSQYAAVFVPGGHAPMNDLMQDSDFGRILHFFHENKRPTAFLCHGPIAALAALPQAKSYRAALVAGDVAAAQASGNGWQYSGYRMAIFSDSEEVPVQQDKLKGELLFSVAAALKGAGGLVEHGADWESFVVRDRELITGQNPASHHAIADAVIHALNESPAIV